MKLQAIHTGVIVEVIVETTSAITSVNGAFPVVRSEDDIYIHYPAHVKSVGAEVTEINPGNVVRIPFELVNNTNNRICTISQEGNKQVFWLLIDQRQVMYVEVNGIVGDTKEAPKQA